MKDTFNFQCSVAPAGEWDLYWIDTGVTAEMVSKMKPYQKINHFPNMSCLARKNHLGRNLMRMHKQFPKDYSFFPQTWLLPLEWNELRAELSKGKCKTYILKPEALSQGKGIFLTRTFDNVNPTEHYVVQRYVRKPYLIDGLKFDMRIYVMVYGCDPLRIYIYKEGLARLATAGYVGPKKENLGNLYMHLTNYAINKNNKNFIFNSDAENANVGHKRSLSFVWKYIDEHGGNSRSLQRKIRRCIVKTLCAVQPQLSRSYRSCQPNDVGNNMCFELLGFDILLDHKLKPWLLEVNHSPSFTTDTPFDHRIKADLLTNAVKMLRMDPANRIQYNQQKQAEFNSRALGRTRSEKLTKEEKEEQRAEAMFIRDKYEVAHAGNFTRIYPDEKLADKYQSFLDFAVSAMEQFYGFRKKEVAPAKSKPCAENRTRSSSKPSSAVPGQRPRPTENSMIKRGGSVLPGGESMKMKTIKQIYSAKKEPTSHARKEALKENDENTRKNGRIVIRSILAEKKGIENQATMSVKGEKYSVNIDGMRKNVMNRSQACDSSECKGKRGIFEKYTCCTHSRERDSDTQRFRHQSGFRSKTAPKALNNDFKLRCRILKVTGK